MQRATAASGNPQLIPATAAGLLTAGSNTISPQHGAQFIEDAYALMKRESLTFEQTASESRRGGACQQAAHSGIRSSDAQGRRLPRHQALEVAARCGFIGEKTRLYQAIHAEFVRVTGKKGLCINVDGALACIMTEMGFRPLQMVAVAVLAVLPGILAHVIEEIEEGKALRIVRDEEQTYLGADERAVARGGNR